MGRGSGGDRLTEASERVRARVVVAGRVQGVFYRDSTRARARQLGVTGWVRNREDGRVEALFEGEEAAVREAVEFARAGPKFARVGYVEVAWEEATGEFADFRVVG